MGSNKLVVGVNDLETWCKKTNHEELLKEWNIDKNDGLVPSAFSFGSQKSVWWKCSLGHEWSARIGNRTAHSSRCPYCSNSKALKGFNDFKTWCEKNGKVQYLDEWDYEANDICPDEILVGSCKKIGWKCKEGHTWRARAIDRINNNTNCPHCISSSITLGVNDLFTTNPSLCKEWDYSLNGELLPSAVSRGMHTAVFWKCRICGHSWKTRIDKRAGFNDEIKSDCPSCAYAFNANRLKSSVYGVNDFETWCKKNKRLDLLSEWDSEKNKLPPRDYTQGSQKIVFWKCKLGHSYRLAIMNRRNNQGCPYCANNKTMIGFNDLASTDPELIEKWDYDLNPVEMSPYTVRKGMHKKAWWKDTCGHKWQANICDMTGPYGGGCPICSGRKTVIGINDFESWCKKNNRNDLLEEWHDSKYSPIEFTRGSGQKIHWKCNKNHTWVASISSRASGSGCPRCAAEKSTSFAEYALLYYIQEKGYEVKHSYKDLGYELDIYIPSLHVAIEYDGSYWHKNKSQQDLKKNQKCVNDRITLYRIREGLAPLNDTSNDYLCTSKNIDMAIQQVLEDIFKVPFDIDRVRDSIAINQARDLYNKSNSLAVMDPSLAQEWHPSKNGILTPYLFAASSGQKVWWLGKCGHEWSATLHARSKGEGCPFCSNRRVLKGFNDLASKYPELLSEWDYDKNDVSPYDILYGTSRKVWWKCKVCAYEWQASVDSRSLLNHGCRICGQRTTAKIHRKRVLCVETGIIYSSIKEAAEKTQTNRSSIANICNGNSRRCKTAGGYHWKYADK